MITPVASQMQHRLRAFWNAILGIVCELALIASIIVIGIAVSVLWWGLFR